MRYLLTGTTGLLGTSILNNFNFKEDKLTCLVHQKKTRVPKKNYITGDLVSYPSLLRATKNIDIIIHCAATINEKEKEKYFLINHQGTKKLIEAAKKNKVVKFVYISSWAINKKGGYYSNSKRLAEKEVKKFKNYLIIRPADIYGEKKSHLHNLASIIKNSKFFPIIGQGNYLVSPVFAEDLAKAILILSKKENNRIVTITGPKIYHFKEIVKLIAEYLRKELIIISIPKEIIYPLIYLFDKLNIGISINLERYRRLTASKIIYNQLSFKEISLKPLYFEEALDQFIIKSLK